MLDLIETSTLCEVSALNLYLLWLNEKRMLKTEWFNHYTNMTFIYSDEFLK